MSNSEKLAKVITDILGVPASELRDERKVGDIPNWDSFNNLQIIAAVEEAFAVHFTTDEILNATKYGDVKELLKKHGVQMQ